MEQEQIDKIKKTAEEFFEKMTMPVSSVDVCISLAKDDSAAPQEQATSQPEERPEVIDLEVKLDEPQILIGQQGQTLFEIQRLLRTILSRKLKKIFYLNLDINDYKKKKIEYLKDMAKDVADQVAMTKEEKALSPMSAYERRVIHAELAQRTDVATESRGDSFDRHIVIKPR